MELQKISKNVRKFFKYEKPDPKPAKINTGLTAPLPIAEQVRRMVHQELSNKVSEEGHETWEESDDFDCEEDLFPRSSHEIVDDLDSQSITDFIEETPLPEPSQPGPDSQPLAESHPAEPIEDQPAPPQDG